MLLFSGTGENPLTEHLALLYSMSQHSHLYAKSPSTSSLKLSGISAVNKFTYQSFFLPEWSKLASEKREIFLLYTKISVGGIYFLSFSKSVLLRLEKPYFIFCNNQIARCSAFLYSSCIITQNSTVSLLGKGWHPPLRILTPPLSVGETMVECFWSLQTDTQNKNKNVE